MTTIDNNPDAAKAELNVHLAPAAAAKLSKEQQKRLADAKGAKSPGDLPGWHSIGNSHKPTHASNRRGPAEKKVRW